MHHLTLRINTKSTLADLFSGVSKVMRAGNYGVIYWSTTEEEITEMGLVVYKEKKQELKEEITNYLLQNQVEDFVFVQPLREKVPSLWLYWYMPKEYNLRFA